MTSLLASSACDRMGKVAFACARHGCYALNSLVDLFKGEQQKNVDFALLKAIETTKVDEQQGILIIYDIVCQYIVHLQRRIGDRLPSNTSIDSAIGLFHVHAHKDECFFRYATSFIPGTGITAGEILESMWSTLNSISPTVRTATLAHRAEVLDDHCNDANHKKCLAMPDTLIRRHYQAHVEYQKAHEYYDNLTYGVPPNVVQDWAEQVIAAESRRMVDRSVMDIYAARIHLGNEQDREWTAEHLLTPPQHWLLLAFDIEEEQYVRPDPEMIFSD